jgi:putative ABC transport system permease protein
MDVLIQDSRHSLRALFRDFGFTATITLTLAIGVGANTAVFGIVRSIMLRPLPYEDSDRLAMVWSSVPSQSVQESSSSYGNIQDWTARNRVFEDLAAFDPLNVTLAGEEWPEQVSAAKVTFNLFSLLRVSPALGRTFTADEEQLQAPVVVLSHETWQRRFAGSRDALGKPLVVGGQSFEVVGVMPEGFGYPDKDAEMWLPISTFENWSAVSTRRGTDTWRVIGRLLPGVSVEKARDELRVIAAELEREHPDANAGLTVDVVSLADSVTGAPLRQTLWTLYGAVALVLLIACANVAHLYLVRGMDRAQGYAVRLALGATAPRLIRHALTESIVLSLLAALASVLVAVVGLRLFVALAPANIPRVDEIAIDPTVLVYGIGLSLLTGIVCAIAPAVSYSRSGPYQALREGRGAVTKTFAQRARTPMVAAQFALAIILVFGANLLIRSFLEARRVEYGFDSTNVLIANLSAASPEGRVSFYERTLQESSTIPGVRSVGLVEEVFISGSPNASITVEGAAPRSVPFRRDGIDGDVFGTLGVPLLEGRTFTASDGPDDVPVAIVNQTMAEQFWPGASPIGRRFRFNSSPWLEVVGVVADMRRQGPERAPIAQAFRPYVQDPSRNMVLLVRTEQAAGNLTETLRARVAAIDRSVPLYGVSTLTQAMDQYLLGRRFQSYLLALFSAVALILAAVGIYGLMQYAVRQRTREIGLRMAVGAVSREVTLMFLGQGLKVALPGLVVGIFAAVRISEAMTSLLFGVGAADVSTIVVTSAVLVLATLLACYVPARRAARVDPLTALRER